MNTSATKPHSTTGRKAILSALFMLCGMMAALLPQQAAAQDKQTTVYMFGFSASFNDSTVYFTDIQKVDKAWVSTKHNMLSERDEYSYQLRDYLKSKGQKTPTCITVYALSIKDIAKKYAKLYERYTTKAKGNYVAKNLTREEFSYKYVAPQQVFTETQQPAEEPKAGRKEKKRKKNG